VFTNGYFDLLHVGHIALLNRSKALGDKLIVGLNSDASIRRNAGEKRPIVPEQQRAHILAAIEAVDYIVLYDEDTPVELLRALKPDVLAKGADYTLDRVVGREAVEAIWRQGRAGGPDAGILNRPDRRFDPEKPRGGPDWDETVLIRLPSKPDVTKVPHP